MDPAAESARRDAPQTWNRYAYVANNPLRYNDPTGEDGNDVANWIDQQIQSVVNLVDAHTNEGTITTLANDAVTAAGALASGAVDMLRVGAATGEAIGSGSSSLGEAVAQDVGRASALALTMAVPANAALRSTPAGAAAETPASATGGSGLGGNPFAGRTAEQARKMMESRGFQPRGPDPVSGKGGYVNPSTGRSHHIDPGNRFGERPHVDVNRPRGYNGPLEKRKYPPGGGS